MTNLWKLWWWFTLWCKLPWPLYCYYYKLNISDFLRRFCQFLSYLHYINVPLYYNLYVFQYSDKNVKELCSSIAVIKMLGWEFLVCILDKVNKHAINISNISRFVQRIWLKLSSLIFNTSKWRMWNYALLIWPSFWKYMFTKLK